MSETALQEELMQTQRHPNIMQGDRKSRFWLMGEEGKSTLSLADDIYKKYFFANQLESFMENASQKQQQVVEESERIAVLVTKWLEDHADQIVINKSGIVGDPKISSSGKIHFHFVVTKKEPVDWISDPLTDELLLFEKKLWKDFQIIRLNSILLPNNE
jgi:hypothetical protein